jgi:hypothetical protein
MGCVSRQELTPYIEGRCLKLGIEQGEESEASIPLCIHSDPGQITDAFSRDRLTSKRFAALGKTRWRFASNYSILFGGAALRVTSPLVCRVAIAA